MEPLLILGKEKFAGVDIRIRVRGGGHTSQVYAIRQALSKVWWRACIVGVRVEMDGYICVYIYIGISYI